MAKKHEQVQNQAEPQTTPQLIAPATLLELSDAELEQVTGGADFNPQPDPPGIPPVTGVGGLPALTAN